MWWRSHKKKFIVSTSKNATYVSPTSLTQFIAGISEWREKQLLG